MNISLNLSGVKLGVLTMDGIHVELVVSQLAREMDGVCQRLRDDLTVEEVAQLDSVQAVRAMFRLWGIDPSRYRPSSEALLRRVVQGKGLYRVSSVVDIANLGSVETGWPYGCYDRARVSEPVAFRLGLREEKYEGIGKRTWHLGGRPVLIDTEGPFGSPISDSARTMVTETTTRIVSVIYAPAGAGDASLQRALDAQAERLARYASGTAAETAIIGV